MKDSKFKKILIGVGTILGVAFSGLMVWKRWSDKKRKNNEDLQKDTYVGAGQPVSDSRKSIYEKYIKRVIDMVLAAIGIIVLSPVFIITAVAIFITDPGPVIFTQKRVGINKTFFKLYKFRSMKMSTPHDVPTHMLENPESYITTVGKFIRKASIDELPQLFNILEGNLAVIGPRPALWNQEDLVAERDKYCANDVMPGLTGWAQINGRDELEISVKAKLDGEYVEKLRKNGFSGILMDTKCFFGTITSVLKSDGVVEGGIGEMKKMQSSYKEKKKILVICQYYKPEPFRISDICEEMVRRGHEVQVVTGYPNYPEGELYDGYGRGKHVDEVINGVKVHRCFTVPRGIGIVKRMMNYYSYSISSVAYVLSKECKTLDGKPYDMVFCNQLSPIMMANAAMAYKKKYDIPILMYCLDLWPESLVAGGIKRDSFIYRYYHRVSKKIYKRMDKILITSRMFSDYLEEKFSIDVDRIEYLPQYAEGIFEKLPEKDEKGTFDFMFAGNIGIIQSVETIIRAAKLLENEPVRFHIVGSGTDLNRLQDISKGVNNVIFYGRRPLEDMPQLYAQVDAMLITLAADPVLSLTLPGKTQSYMAVGKPIIGAIDGETRRVIENAKCGYCGRAEDANELAENIRKFISDDTDRTVMSRNSRKYYEENFRVTDFMNKLEDRIQTL